MNERKRKKYSRRLFEAVLHGDASRVRALLRAGADPGRPDREGVTPLYEASVNGRTGVARVLLRAGAAPDAESAGLGADGTPLCAAACWGHTATVRELLAHGADPNLREEHGAGWSPLEWAREGAHSETAAVLLAAGAISPERAA
ncbi:ankyrin repeat domain-containing protein [Streptomyces spectabilis]|uniref:Ankyrin repeat domain-containing protein n=1 Tax=Streptomyces spectabilis TaxID=68270 RepID=A0A5P2XL17_STRST|nr:ankyrin repeat domain-containing protein [Streptomyces spectabilis]MBB5106912.1 ankyrin repeat protein [Streptomyces spectabilis]MCI3906358.1 ankyrin repeat domain-containing protein [Streptomyces spectabilis]QEV63216.1 ankyrin repeat domain-containing protein [Streptomyces spectabilis]GGV41171.1 serine/threonine protein kinase [Streptomyces spectabilis]